MIKEENKNDPEILKKVLEDLDNFTKNNNLHRPIIYYITRSNPELLVELFSKIKINRRAADLIKYIVSISDKIFVGNLFYELSYEKIDDLYPDISEYLENVYSDNLVDIKRTKNIVPFIKMLKNVNIPDKEMLFEKKYIDKYHIIHLKKENIYLFIHEYDENKINFYNVIVDAKNNSGICKKTSISSILKFVNELNKKYKEIIENYMQKQ